MTHVSKSFKSNNDLVCFLTEKKAIKSLSIKHAFLAIDRNHFVQPEDRGCCYEDCPLAIGPEATISQPTTVAMMLEVLQVKSGESILDVGSGSGYTTALLASLVGETGCVLGLEIQKALCAFSQKNLEAYSFSNIRIKQAREGILGEPGKQFHKILVSAAANTLPNALLEQVHLGGTLVIPIQSEVWVLTKTSDQDIQKRVLEGFRFVDLK